MPLDLAALAAPFPPAEIEWRVGSTTGDKSKGMALAYLTARHVMDRLDTVCGFANWQDRYEFHGTRTVCYLSIRIGDEWVTKADGAGDSDVEAEKGAISDALKRAAVKWGIGRYLYDLASPWVEIEPAGRSFKIKATEFARLEKLLGGATGQTIPLNTPPAEMPRISSYLAKKLLKTDVLLSDIDTAGNERRCAEIEAMFGSDLAWLPQPWLTKFRERLEERREEIASGKAPKTAAESANDSLDRQFAETMRE